jgi:alkanesulfonate monooxygenase SsuD/methylene tetrahydromethanopterin reductase-like flavin-dependent oxidoreductase (luciferase family)
MKFDIFFSICQTEVDGYLPNERKMFENFFDQLKLADDLGFETAWLAETHFSCEAQKQNPDPVIPHFKGEIGLNTDVFQMAHKIFAMTKKIHVGSAIRNILVNGGPLSHAESARTFLSLHSLDPQENRKIHLGFAAGRFPFSVIPYGIRPRNGIEESAWSVVKRLLFLEATEIFLRALRGEVICDRDIQPKILKPAHFKSPEEWQKIVATYQATTGKQKTPEEIPIDPFWVFDKVGMIPKESPLHLIELYIGSHDPSAQDLANSILPCGVFNLSITPSDTIEKTHDRMSRTFHKDGGTWNRHLMPRTALVFINNDKGVAPQVQSTRAKQAARSAHENYWRAMEGTLDPRKIEEAVCNSIAGTPEEVAEQIREKYRPDDRLMLWFDFNNHDNEAIKKSMTAFMEEVRPRLPEGIAP